MPPPRLPPHDAATSQPNVGAPPCPHALRSPPLHGIKCRSTSSSSPSEPSVAPSFPLPKPKVEGHQWRTPPPTVPVTAPPPLPSASPIKGTPDLAILHRSHPPPHLLSSVRQALRRRAPTATAVWPRHSAHSVAPPTNLGADEVLCNPRYLPAPARRVPIHQSGHRPSSGELCAAPWSWVHAGLAHSGPRVYEPGLPIFQHKKRIPENPGLITNSPFLSNNQVVVQSLCTFCI
jgi:hypothetical protein